MSIHNMMMMMMMNIYVIYRQWSGDKGSVQRNAIVMTWFPPLTGFEPKNFWSEVRSTKHSAMQSLQNEPGHNKIYNMTCMTSEDLDQPAHQRSLIRVFIDPMNLLQPLGYSKRNEPSTASRLFKEEWTRTIAIQGGHIGWSEPLLVTQVLL